MRRILFCLVIAELFFSTCPALASWYDVVPSIQVYYPADQTVSIKNVSIIYRTDNFQWTLAELQQQLANKHVSIQHVWHVANWSDPLPAPGAGVRIIHIGLWEDMHSFFESTNYEEFQHQPAGEEYYINIRPLGSTYGIDITASTERGLNYAVTSLWQAIDQADTTIERGAIRDFPQFPRRYIFDQNNFYEHGSTNQFSSSFAHADGILTVEREILLYNKGNGFVQYGDAAQYYPQNNSNEIGRIDSVINRLQSGSNPNSPHPDRWDSFGFDWITGIARHETEGPTNGRELELACGDVVKTCRISHVSGNSYQIAPDYSIPVTNGLFQDDNNQDQVPDFWRFGTGGSWSLQQEGNGNRYARKDIPQTSSAFVGQRFQVQDTTGLPMRLLMFDASVRVGTSDSVRVIFQHRMCKDENGFSAYDYPHDIERFHKNEPSPSVTLRGAGGDSTWHRVRFQFYTLGMEWDSLRLEFKNLKSNTGATADIDSVSIYDTDIYHVYLLPENSQASIRILRDGVQQAQIGSDDITFTNAYPDSSPDYVYRRATVGFTYVTDSTITAPPWTAELRYHIFLSKKMPAYVSNLACPSLGSEYSREWRGSRPDVVDTAVVSHMNWFEDRFTDQGQRPKMRMTGYFSRDNELRFQGYSQDDMSLYNEHGWTSSEIHANFTSRMYEALQEQGRRERPLFLWADMFNSHHNGKLLGRLNNPFPPFDGFDASENQIPGANREDNLVFVDWWTRDVLNQDSAAALFDTWATIPDPDHNSWEVMFAMMAVPSDPIGNFQARLPYYRDIARACSTAREQGMRFSGGGLACEAKDSTNWQVYRDRLEYLRMWWKPDPLVVALHDFHRYYRTSESSAHATYKVFPVPYPEDHEAQIDSVVLEYRFGLSGGWLRTKVSTSSDSIYEFSISLPDSGGVVEYRIWSFDNLGRYSSFPPVQTKWTDPDAGERRHFTFERRKKTPITKPTVFYAPGIISQEHQIEPGGSIVVEPLPGYRYSTMQVSDSGAIKFVPSLLTVMSYFTVAGVDTSQIVFELADSATHWGGIQGDSLGKVELRYVTFNTGTTPVSLQKTPTDTVHVFDHAVFGSGLEIRGGVKVFGTGEASAVTIKSGGVLTVQPGSELSFADSACLTIEAGGKLISIGADTSRTVFKASVDSLGWLGIQVARDAADTSIIRNCDIQNAKAGVMADRAIVKLSHCDITGCEAGVLAINGGIVLVDSCGIEQNKDGVVLANLSIAKLKGDQISQNTGAGVLALSRSTVYLEGCNVDQNDGDGTVGGIGLYTGSEGFLKCTTVNENTGPGITAFNGIVMLSSVDTAGTGLTNWRGNSIFDNVTVAQEGQLMLRGRIGLGLYNGHNHIADSTTTHKLVRWEDHPTRDWWRDVYWGSTDTSAILNRLPSNVVLSKIDSSWNSCPNFTGAPTSPDSLMRVFLTPHNNELSGNYGTANTGYRSIINDTPASDYAFAASDRLVNSTLASDSSFAAMRDYLFTKAASTSDQGLKRWLNNSLAWCWAELDSFSRAKHIYDSLATSTPTRLDRVSAKVQKQMVAVRQFSTDSVQHTADEVLAHIDSSRLLLEGMNVWGQWVITDSTVMYAPATVEEIIEIQQPNGKLYILPHPGAENPVVSFRDSGSVWTAGYYSSWPRSKLVVQGAPDNPVILDWDSTDATVFGNMWNPGGHVELKHAILRGSGMVSYSWTFGHSVIFRADSCRFESFDDGLWLVGTDTSCYVRNCTFTHVGTPVDVYGAGFDAGLSIGEGAGTTIENCDFDTNTDHGIFAYMVNDVNIRNCTFRRNGENGIMTWEGSGINVECSDFTDNGDSLAEIWADGGVVNLLGGRNQLSDSSGTLIYATDPSYVEMENGENQLNLLDGTGYYLKSGDTTQTWDITWNNWVPVEPTDSTFFNYLYPHNPAKWTVDSSLADYLACGDGGAQSVGGDGNVIVLPGNGDGGIDSHGSSGDNLSMMSASPGASKSSKSNAKNSLMLEPATSCAAKIAPTSKLEQIAQHNQELARWREFKTMAKDASRSEAVQAGMAFIDAFPSSTKIPAALSSLAGLARHGGSELKISRYLEDKARSLPYAKTRTTAMRLAQLTKAYEGDAKGGLAGLEELMETAETPQDSIRALVDAMGVYCFHNEDHKLEPRHPQVRTENLREFGRRVTDLAKQLENPSRLSSNHAKPIPTSFALYQNYPNPFNPTTEIRFDLPENVRVELKIFNILGQEVATLVDDLRPAGSYRLFWDSKNQNGMTVSSGVYVYQLKAGKFTDAKKMVLIR